MILSRRIFLPFVIVAAAVVIAGSLWATRPEIESQPSRERVWPVAAVEVTHGDARPVLSVYGEVVAGREVELRALVAGIVTGTSTNLVEGGVVKEGELILAIDEFDYRTGLDEKQALLREARAKLVEIEARHRGHLESIDWERQELNLLQRDYDRTQALRAKGAVSEKFLDNARMALFTQRRVVVNDETNIATETARIEQQRSIIKRLEVQVYQAKRDLKETKLNAPFDGFLHSIAAAKGKRLGVNDRVATLVDAGRLDVRVHLSNQQFGRLIGGEDRLEGRSVEVTWQVGEHRNEYFARVERIGARIEATSGGVELYARIGASSIASRLRPGAFVGVRLPEQHYADIVRLPETALHGETVYVIVNQRLEARTVELIAKEGTSVLLRGELRDADQVVTTRFPEIAPGLKVEVR